MGYLLGRGEGAELRAKQKSALDQIREHHKRKAEAEKDGETVKVLLHCMVCFTV